VLDRQYACVDFGLGPVHGDVFFFGIERSFGGFYLLDEHAVPFDQQSIDAPVNLKCYTVNLDGVGYGDFCLIVFGSRVLYALVAARAFYEAIWTAKAARGQAA